MTKEELEKDAEEYEKRKHYRYEDNDYCGDIADGIIQAYLAGAEPREKKIEELEKENRLLGERCNQLLKDKGNLTDQIEKMKCPQNCKDFGDCIYSRCPCDKWQLRR